MVLLVNSIFVSSATINIASYDSTNFIALENLVQLALISTITISPSALIGIISVVNSSPLSLKLLVPLGWGPLGLWIVEP